MKLNKTQIDALTDKFYNEIIVKYNEENNKYTAKQLEEYKDLYNKGISLLKEHKFLESINVYFKNNMYSSLRKDESFNSWTSNYKFSNSIKKLKAPIRDIIKQDIILATIDSKSIDDIMTVLKQKYK